MKTKNIFIAILATIVLFQFFIIIRNDKAKTKKESNTKFDAFNMQSTDSIKDFTYKIIANQNTFGYDINMGNKLIIHQPIIPGMPGNDGFSKKNQAEKTALLVIEKMRKNIMPPSVTEEEIKSILKEN